MAVVGIWSGKNYLKHALAAPATMSKPSSADGFGAFTSTSVIAHNLGYEPLVRGYYDPNSDSTIYPLIGQYLGGAGLTSESPLLTVAPFAFFVDDVTTTTVTFRTYSSGSIAGTFTYYYRIYIDPTL